MWATVVKSMAEAQEIHPAELTANHLRQKGFDNE